MRFLVDTNLPKAFCRLIAGKGHEATHVLDLDLAQSPDLALWRHAMVSGSCIVTKDRDFAIMARLPGPQVIWLRTGNAPNSVMMAAVEKAWILIEQQLASGIRLIECT